MVKAAPKTGQSALTKKLAPYILCLGAGFGAGLAAAPYFNDAAAPGDTGPKHPALIEKGDAFSGTASVYDGDTITLTNGEYEYKVRVFGIDTPELRQTCMRGAAVVECGKQARDFLRAFTGAHEVRCVAQDIDAYRRIVAQCHVNGTDIAKHMLRAGMAFDTPEYTDIYASDEDYARTRRLGLWALEFEAPDRWRECNMGAVNRRPADCALS